MFQGGCCQSGTPYSVPQYGVWSRRIGVVSRHVPCLFFRGHGHGPGCTSVLLYSPLGRMHDVVGYYRAGRESRLVPGDAINTPARVDLGRPSPSGRLVNWSIPPLSLSLSCEPQSTTGPCSIPSKLFAAWGMVQEEGGMMNMSRAHNRQPCAQDSNVSDFPIASHGAGFGRTR